MQENNFIMKADVSQASRLQREPHLLAVTSKLYLHLYLYHAAEAQAAVTKLSD